MGKKFEPLEKTSASLFDAWKPEENAAAVAEQNDEIVAKRASVWAVASCVAGVFSFLSLVHLGFLACSAFGAAAAIGALVAIARSGGELTGKSLALVGLALSVATAVAGPVRLETYRADFNRQAEVFCQSWFDAARRGDYMKVRLMDSPYWSRQTILNRDEETIFWKSFIASEDQHYGVHAFATNRTLLALAALGDRAKATFYRTTSVQLGEPTETTARIYAITVEPKAGSSDPKQTFFLEMRVSRRFNVSPQGKRSIGWADDDSDWAPLQLDADGRPISLEAKDE